MNQDANARATKSDGAKTMNCSFCGKDSEHVKQLVAGGGGGFICDKCAWLSMVIVAKAKLAAALRFRASSPSA
jgi:ATP-dependent protease Clp ATPase subunit